MKKLFVVLFSLFLTSIASVANAGSGLVYEVGGGGGYIYQGDSLQFKVLGNYFKDPHHDYQDITAIKLSAAKDIMPIESANLYAGVSYWNDFLGSRIDSHYYDRTGAVLGLRQAVNRNLQVEVLTEVVSYANSEAYNNNTDTYSLNTAGSGLGFFRNGAVAVSYLF